METLINQLNEKYPDFHIKAIPDMDMIHIIIYSPPKPLIKNLTTNYYISKNISTKKLCEGIEGIIEKILDGDSFAIKNNLK